MEQADETVLTENRGFMRQLRLASVWSLVLASLALPAIAQSERHPTDAELQQLAQELRQKIPNLQATDYYRDRRSLEDWQALSAYVETWERADPAIAPFLGEWVAIEEALYIYPSTTRSEVCIVDINLDQGDFYTGQVRNGKVYTDQNLVFFLDNNFLGSTFVYDDRPGIYEYANPRPLPDPAADMGQYFPEAVAAFEAAGCLIDLPE
ncbi:hypothetical protein IQ254_03275 [Nodosilinea sp. LEGE 07088]|uniref:hypothetical protein n=1 Tax=Nodosilinea sp. LEGE 07088 TaxID=2777968 RepID=UPI001880E94F|nr:hypothetical protein [Nodosilinea sp. LEGE 07088]MBE9136232.1 hypothetical protein [Nodosilinea sp. LEGE 07088]